MTQNQFPVSAPSASPVFYRTYSRRVSPAPGGALSRESWSDVTDRAVGGLAKIGKLTPGEAELIRACQLKLTAIVSGRWLWVGGTDWSNIPANYSGGYNCTSTLVTDWDSLAAMMDLAMMGSGTGAMLEAENVALLPPIVTTLSVSVVGEPGSRVKGDRLQYTHIESTPSVTTLSIGDSREGWVGSYQALLELASTETKMGRRDVVIDLSHVRAKGEPLNGFGGVANPVKLKELYPKIAKILDSAVGRQLTPVECCLIIDEAALVVVAGNVRRSAGLRQFSSDDIEAATIKDNLWVQREDGNWAIDPARDALRMANHTRVFHRKPTLDEVRDSVTKQYHSGEGAIQYAPEAIARANRDIISTPSHRRKFLQIYNTQGVGAATDYLAALSPTDDAKLLHHRIHRYGLNPCAEIIGIDYHCNLAEVHLNRINPDSDYDQFEAFRAATLSVASLLHQQFEVDRYRYSREVDPIVGVSITGLFDFFVHKFGAAWLRWWAAGRSANTEQGRVFKVREAEYLTTWRDIVKYTLKDYCDEHKITCPNRCTTVQPSGTKSLLTGASPGWHPPKARRFIRRITFGAYDPVALACIDYGYNVVPSQSDKDEAGNLLNDPYDDRCTEWLVEIPTEVSWANLKGVDSVDISEFSAAAQFDFYMQVQTHYTEHNTSATIEFRESEIESLAQCIHGAIDKDQGYISAALLARFDDSETYPRLPFEPIDKATYDRLHGDVLRRRRGDDFEALLSRHDTGLDAHNGPAGCDSDKCLTGGRR